MKGRELKTEEGQKTNIDNDYFNQICEPCVKGVVEILETIIEECHKISPGRFDAIIDFEWLRHVHKANLKLFQRGCSLFCNRKVVQKCFGRQTF